MGKKNIEIKGTSEGLLITIMAEDWQVGQQILFAEKKILRVPEGKRGLRQQEALFQPVRHELLRTLSCGRQIRHVSFSYPPNI